MADGADIAGALGGFTGSIIGMMQAQGNYDAIAKLREEAKALYGDISLPVLEKLARSKLNDVAMDPKYKGAQDEALDRLMGISKAGGMDAQSREQLNEAKQQAFGVERGMSEAADTRLARRGTASTGADVAAQSAGAQAGTDRAYQGSLHTASDASKRALDALIAGGGMAERMGTADVAQKDRSASADDRIAEFNSGLAGENFRNQITLAAGKLGTINPMVEDQYAAAERGKREAAGIGRGAGALVGAGADKLGGGAGAGGDYQGPVPGYNDTGGSPTEWSDPYKKKNPDDPSWSE